MTRIKEPTWYNWPNREYAGDLEDLARMAIRCDAWRAFFSSRTARLLKNLKGHIIWFNKHQAFDALICEFDCSEQALIKMLKRLMRPGFEREIVFTRTDIYDARAWAHLPLDCFVDVRGLSPRTSAAKYRDQHEVLVLNEMPVLQFGLNLPWVVERSCFTLHHRIKDGKRIAVMTFAHPRLDGRFENKRWVADGEFPREATKAEMETELMTDVRAKCAKFLVTITETEQLNAGGKT